MTMIDYGDHMWGELRNQLRRELFVLVTGKYSFSSAIKASTPLLASALKSGDEGLWSATVAHGVRGAYSLAEAIVFALWSHARRTPDGVIPGTGGKSVDDEPEFMGMDMNPSGTAITPQPSDDNDEWLREALKQVWP